MPTHTLQLTEMRYNTRMRFSQRSGIGAGSTPFAAEQVRCEQERGSEATEQEYAQDGRYRREVVKEQLGDHQREHDVARSGGPVD